MDTGRINRQMENGGGEKGKGHVDNETDKPLGGDIKIGREEGEMNRVFVCGPYWNDDPCIRLANVFRAKQAAAELVRRGYAVYCPHLWHYAPQKGMTEEIWVKQDIAWLLESHYVLRLPGTSVHANAEVRIANKKGIPVYFSLDDFPNLVKEE